jgi:hypothetical protein
VEFAPQRLIIVLKADHFQEAAAYQRGVSFAINRVETPTSRSNCSLSQRASSAEIAVLLSCWFQVINGSSYTFLCRLQFRLFKEDLKGSASTGNSRPRVP